MCPSITADMPMCYGHRKCMRIAVTLSFMPLYTAFDCSVFCIGEMYTVVPDKLSEAVALLSEGI